MRIGSRESVGGDSPAISLEYGDGCIEFAHGSALTRLKHIHATATTFLLADPTPGCVSNRRRIGTAGLIRVVSTGYRQTCLALVFQGRHEARRSDRER